MLLKSKFDNEWLDNRFQNGGDGRMFEYELIYHMTGTTGGLAVVRPMSCTGLLWASAHSWMAFAEHMRPWQGPIDTVV